MKYDRPRLAEALASLLASLIALVVLYGPILEEVNQKLFSGVADGIKNYFVVFYPVLYGHSWFLSTSMAYPFQEHLIYQDAQPLLIWILRFIGLVTPIESWITGLFNGAILFSVVACSLVLFGILRLLDLRTIPSVLAGVGLAFLSPQLLRMLGHYALAYALPIPICWYLLIRFRFRTSLGLSLLISLNTLLWSLLHTYFMGLLSLLVGGTWALLFLRRLVGKDRSSTDLEAQPMKSFLSHAFLQVALPGLLMLGFIGLTDPHLGERGRSAADFDPTIYSSTLEGLLIPFAHPLGEGLVARVERLGNHTEGMSYMGLAVPLILLLVLLLHLAGKIRILQILPIANSESKEEVTASQRNRILMDGLIIGGVSLLVSLPWIWSLGSGWLWDWVGPLRQFRAIGRFSWISYYLLSVYAFAELDRFRRITTGIWSRSLLLVLALALGIQLVEANFLAQEILQSWRISAVPAALLLPSAAEGGSTAALPASIETSRFQAILPIPYYHIGSDRDFRFQGADRSIPVSMAVSMKTRLPLLAVHAARTPWYLTQLSLSIFDRGPELSEFRLRFPRQDPFLLVVTSPEISEAEKELVGRASFLAEASGVRFYELSFEEAMRR